ncbi:MAG: hypothetical protein QOJ23_1467 [Actinomycetota bacterium]|jgi:hypothetical protein|nr:hypothetical protein [Actinomycetota bacterium]MDQ1497260.1 hypothetical protein [Actinomycetota bacterium]
MNPNTVFSASLVASLVLWFPSMQACLRGDLDLASAGLRYVAALVVSRLALNFLARLVNAYRAAPEGAAPAGDPLLAPPAPHTAGLDTDPASPPQQRRRDDRAAAGDVDPETLAA